jgi:hypothetical protein
VRPADCLVLPAVPGQRDILLPTLGSPCQKYRPASAHQVEPLTAQLTSCQQQLKCGVTKTDVAPQHALCICTNDAKAARLRYLRNQGAGVNIAVVCSASNVPAAMFTTLSPADMRGGWHKQTNKNTLISGLGVRRAVPPRTAVATAPIMDISTKDRPHHHGGSAAVIVELLKVEFEGAAAARIAQAIAHTAPVVTLCTSAIRVCTLEGRDPVPCRSIARTAFLQTVVEDRGCPQQAPCVSRLAIRSRHYR